MGKIKNETETVETETVETETDSTGSWDEQEAPGSGYNTDLCRALEATSGVYRVKLVLVEAFTGTGKPTRFTAYFETIEGTTRNYDGDANGAITKAAPGRFIPVGFLHPVQEPDAAAPKPGYVKMSRGQVTAFKNAIGAAQADWANYRLRTADGEIRPMIGAEATIVWQTAADRNDEYGESVLGPVSAYSKFSVDPPRRKTATRRRPQVAGQAGAAQGADVADPGAGSAGGAWG